MKRLGIPYALGQIISISETSYYGADVESLLTPLTCPTTSHDLLPPSWGICFIDAIDKMCQMDHDRNSSKGKNISNELLQIIEGTTCHVPSEGHFQKRDISTTSLKTYSILFIFSVASKGLERIIQRCVGQGHIGFQSAFITTSSDSMLSFATKQDLIHYGMSPKLCGRLYHITHTEQLTPHLLKQILLAPKQGLLHHYQQEFQLFGVDLQWDDQAVKPLPKKPMMKAWQLVLYRPIVVRF